MSFYPVSDVCFALACLVWLHCLRDNAPGRGKRLQNLICCEVKDPEIWKEMTSSLSSQLVAQILISEKEETVGLQPLQVLKSLR